MPSGRGRAWADFRIIGTALVAGTPNVSNLLGNAPVEDTLTAVRIVLDVTVQYLVSTTIVDSLSIVDIGIGVASTEAVLAGFAALPRPDDGTNFPPRGWLYVASQPVSQQAESTGVISTVARFQADLRSMRKIDKGVLFMVITNTNITVGGAMQMTGRVRTLCLT